MGWRQWWNGQVQAPSRDPRPILNYASDDEVSAVLAQEVVDAHMARMTAAITAESTRPGFKDEEYKRELFNEMQRLALLAHKLDRTRMSRDDIATLYSIMYNDLPYRIDHFQRLRGSSTGWSTPITALAPSLRSFCQQLNSIVLAQIDPLYQKSQSAGRNAEALESLPETVVKPVFPALRALTSTVGDAVAEVRQLWERADNSVSTVEDRFTVDQIAQSYLPESWQMVATFENMSPSLQVEVEKLLLHQLAVLRQQLEEMLANVQGSNLAALRAQTSFIEEQRSTRGTSRLELSK